LQFFRYTVIFYMKISLNWLKDYLDTDLDPSKIGEILTDIGLEVEGEEG